jgi:hypothetical protein
MRKSLWLVLAVVLSTSAAMADQVYTVTGTTSNPTGAISGTITFDSTTGSVNVDLLLPRSVVFTDSISLADQVVSNGSTTLADPSGDLAIIFIGEAPVTSSGFGDVVDPFRLTADVGPDTDLSASGTLTPAPAPEPSSLALIVLGVGALFVMRKRFAKSHLLFT